MSDSLNLMLAVGKQAYEEMIQLVSIADLADLKFPAGAKRDRVMELLRKLDAIVGSVQRIMSAHIAESAETPVVTLPAPHRAFCQDVLLPEGKTIQRAYLEISGFGFAADLFLDDSTVENPSAPILNAMSWGLERWNDMLDEEEHFEWLERGFDVKTAQEMVAMPWFRPDEWSQNLKLLQPVLVDRPAHELRNHVRYRLTEIYRAFSLGLWMASIALSRSLIEFSLKANSPRLGILTTYIGAGGRTDEKSLKQLGEEIAAVVPILATPIETVREAGNRILHPKKRDVIAHPKVMRTEALECIRAARMIVENLYSEDR